MRETTGGRAGLLPNLGGGLPAPAPVAIGMGPFDAADFIEIEWSDGVFQTELGVRAGERHLVAETQRQIEENCQ